MSADIGTVFRFFWFLLWIWGLYFFRLFRAIIFLFLAFIRKVLINQVISIGFIWWFVLAFVFLIFLDDIFAVWRRSILFNVENILVRINYLGFSVFWLIWLFFFLLIYFRFTYFFFCYFFVLHVIIDIINYFCILFNSIYFLVLLSRRYVWLRHLAICDETGAERRWAVFWKS